MAELVKGRIRGGYDPNGIAKVLKGTGKGSPCSFEAEYQIIDQGVTRLICLR